MKKRNPLEEIANAHKIKKVIANGQVFEVDDLVNNNIQSTPAPK